MPATIQRRHWSNALRVEEDFQKRHILRILACTLGYVVLSTVLLCVFYVYLMDPSVEGASFWTALAEIVARPDQRPSRRLSIATRCSRSPRSAM